MNKFIRNTIIYLILFIGLGYSTITNINISYANTDNNSSITAIDSNVGVSVDGNGVTLAGVDGDTSKAFSAFLGFIRLLSGAGALVMLMFFVINFVKLGASGTNANARAQAISGLVWSGIATVCLSMSLVIFMFFFKMDKIIDNNQSSSNSSKDDR